MKKLIVTVTLISCVSSGMAYEEMCPPKFKEHHLTHMTLTNAHKDFIGRFRGNPGCLYGGDAYTGLTRKNDRVVDVGTSSRGVWEEGKNNVVSCATHNQNCAVDDGIR